MACVQDSVQKEGNSRDSLEAEPFVDVLSEQSQGILKSQKKTFSLVQFRKYLDKKPNRKAQCVGKTKKNTNAEK